MMAVERNGQAPMLSQLTKGMILVSAEVDRPVTGLSMDSRQIQTGDLFLACIGQTVSGVDFIDSAIANGAVAVLWEPKPEVEVVQLSWRTSPDGARIPLLAVADLSSQVGIIADRFYGQPSKLMFITGITGTNGKTSCSQFLAQALSHDAPCGVIGTLGHGLYGQLASTSHTTPDAIECHHWLANILAAGATSVAMEVSSHALHQGRVNGIDIDCAVFTNLTRDHLDYHGDMQNYGMTKRTLFDVPGLQHAVINIDDEFGRELVDDLRPDLNVVSYGFNKSFSPDVYGHDVMLDMYGIRFRVTTPWGQGQLSAPLLGRFNASNLLAVLSVLSLQGISFKDALARLAQTSDVPGRMKRFGGDEQPLVIVDYAHTPDALEQVLKALREHSQGKVWCVFGCGGDRDKGKRPLMGRVAEQYADQVVLTDDNPRAEAAAGIIFDIQSGMQNPDAVYIEQDRRRAIAQTLTQASFGDVVLIAGKGHENYQLIGDKKLAFSDVDEVQAQLKVLMQ